MFGVCLDLVLMLKKRLYSVNHCIKILISINLLVILYILLVFLSYLFQSIINKGSWVLQIDLIFLFEIHLSFLNIFLTQLYLIFIKIRTYFKEIIEQALIVVVSSKQTIIAYISVNKKDFKIVLRSIFTPCKIAHVFHIKFVK